jgi:hypothetical protein
MAGPFPAGPILAPPRAVFALFPGANSIYSDQASREFREKAMANREQKSNREKKKPKKDKNQQKGAPPPPFGKTSNQGQPLPKK